MNDNDLELRMYGLVMYQLSPIQAGIQYQHSVTKYGRKYNHTEKYGLWADKWMTSIVLNGGTTNLNLDRLGTLNQHFQTLQDNAIEVVAFYEPDLGDQMTAICFIVDERVFNKIKYPDWKPSLMYCNGTYPPVSQEWIDSIGGEQNFFLRNFLKQFQLWR